MSTLLKNYADQRFHNNKTYCEVNVNWRICYKGVRSYGNAYKHYPDVARVERVYIDPAHSEEAQHPVSSLHSYGLVFCY